MSKYYSDQQAPEDLIDLYTSPVLESSSSPGTLRRPLDSTPSHDEMNDIGSLPLSPPGYRPMPSHHRTPSTNSGYFRRSELFGRTTPDPAVTTSLSSRGLARFEQRRLKNLSSPGRMQVSTPLVRKSSTHRGFVFPKRSSMYSLRRDHNGGYRLSNPGPSQFLSRSSTMSLQDSYSNIKLESTGANKSPNELVGSSRGPGSACASKSFAHPSGITATNHHHEVGLDARKVSPAEEALRHTLSSGALDAHKPPSRTLSLSRKMFPRTRPVNTETQSLKSRFSDDNISVLEYVEPQTLTESPRAILDRVRAREDEHQETSAASLTALGVADAQNTSAISSTVSSMQIASSPEEMSVAASQLSSSSASSDPVASKEPPSRNKTSLTLALPATIFAQQPVEPRKEQLVVSDVKVIIDQEPLIAYAANGLPLYGAPAIIYCRTTFTAFRFALLNLGTEVDTLNLASDMVIALVTGISICILIHIIGGGRLGEMTENVLQGFGMCLGMGHQAVVHGVQKGRQQYVQWFA